MHEGMCANVWLNGLNSSVSCADIFSYEKKNISSNVWSKLMDRVGNYQHICGLPWVADLWSTVIQRSHSVD